MKKIMLFLLLLMTAGQLNAQDIQITRFERNYTSLIASMNPVYDNTGEAGAVIRLFVREKGFQIEPNLGVLKKESHPNEIRLWVPRGTKRITIRKQGVMPLTGYEIPVAIESKVTYEAELSVTEEALNRQKANKGHNVYIGAGYNVVSLSGPSVALGFDIKKHIIELGAVFGLNKTDDLYFYDSNSDIMGAYNYQDIRIQLRYGYDLKVTDYFSVMPQVGGTFNIYIGNEVVKGTSNKYESANSFSAYGAIRLVTSLNNRFKLHITPEYDFAVTDEKKYKVLSKSDKTFKSWTEGFNLNIGLIYYF